MERPRQKYRGHTYRGTAMYDDDEAPAPTQSVAHIRILSLHARVVVVHMSRRSAGRRIPRFALHPQARFRSPRHYPSSAHWLAHVPPKGLLPTRSASSSISLDPAQDGASQAAALPPNSRAAHGSKHMLLETTVSACTPRTRRDARASARDAPYLPPG